MLGRVEATGLVKQFRTFKRKEGLWGAIQDLFVREYATVRAVDEVSFTLAPGEMVGYIGPNGAGKSTSVKMLTGILVPTEGTVEANGYVPWKERPRRGSVLPRTSIRFESRTEHRAEPSSVRR